MCKTSLSTIFFSSTPPSALRLLYHHLFAVVDATTALVIVEATHRGGFSIVQHSARPFPSSPSSHSKRHGSIAMRIEVAANVDGHHGKQWWQCEDHNGGSATL